MQGNSGPTSTAGYVNTTLKGAVTLHNGIQIWTVPFTALYKLTVAGASGGDTFFSGGQGAIVNGSVHLTKGTELHLLIAGGGGGAGGPITARNGDNGQASRNGSVYGGVNGLGGSVCANEINNAGGGGGFNGDGKCSFNITCTHPRKCNQGGLSYLNGGLGGSGNGLGGFGGGGAADNVFPGGGGGYSGGGVHASLYSPKGGGGGSYYTGEMKPSTEVNEADGYVLIDYD
ncbi:hypothetical protein OS493_010034 [Desmophyllum pertusum]|uniref:Uncharacterized protein n=1 Tax=Desmophyllum pertusum TaxID=174260 RepID=A0A9X0CG15_9CNID|nr:hypothetical protein OS493_010034 [Desmophyllum pertusum]